MAFLQTSYHSCVSNCPYCRNRRESVTQIFAHYYGNH